MSTHPQSRPNLKWSSLFAILFVILVGTSFLANPPMQKISETQGTVLGANDYDRGGRRIHIGLDSGRDLYLLQKESIKLKHAERVVVEVWKRRFFGHKTIYKKL
jgi:hypothetical protein